MRFAVPALAIALVASQALAHVTLDAPNGGEELEAGSVSQIVWHETVTHQLVNFDLWYSVNGPEGPWLEIAPDINPAAQEGSFSYDWTVPETPSEQVRVRVRQDNVAVDYEDISNANLAILTTTAAETVTVVLEPDQDATLYEGDGSLANGAGSYLFTGRTAVPNGGVERRALLAFAPAQVIPAGATITGVSLELTMSRTTSGEQTVALFTVLESWGEGPSDPGGQEGGGTQAQEGDATWAHRLYPSSSWMTAGGTLASQRSATQQVAGTGAYTFASEQMTADVQQWLDTPADGFGWALVIPDAEVGSAKRFDSKDSASAANRPRLRVSYELVGDPPGAAFMVSPEHPIIGRVVQFTDASTGSPTQWEWDFGDGATSQLASPSHTYLSPGEKYVTLTVSNTSGSTSASMQLVVAPQLRRPTTRRR